MTFDPYLPPPEAQVPLVVRRGGIWRPYLGMIAVTVVGLVWLAVSIIFVILEGSSDRTTFTLGPLACLGIAIGLTGEVPEGRLSRILFFVPRAAFGLAIIVASVLLFLAG